MIQDRKKSRGLPVRIDTLRRTESRTRRTCGRGRSRNWSRIGAAFLCPGRLGRAHLLRSPIYRDPAQVASTYFPSNRRVCFDSDSSDDS